MVGLHGILLAGALLSAVPPAPQPDFRAERGVWLYEGKPFIETTAHAIHHTFVRDRDAGLADLRGLAAAGFKSVEVYWIWDRALRLDGTFDFGDAQGDGETSPLAEGCERVNAHTAYTGDRGYGWTDTRGLADRDRESPASDARRRDFVMDRTANADHTFRVDVPPGTYRVTITMGDAHLQWGPMGVLVDGKAVLAGVQPGSPSTAQAGSEGPRRVFFDSPGNDLQELPVGDVAFDNVPFHVLDPASNLNSCLLFASRSREVSRLVKAEGIEVGLKDVAALHFLHGAGRNAPEGTPIGRYVLSDDDGTEAVQQIVVGVNIGSWWGDPDEHGPACTVAWAGENPSTRRWDTQAVLYRYRWTNPHPEKLLVSLDIEGYWLACNPFVVAVTAEH